MVAQIDYQRSWWKSSGVTANGGRRAPNAGGVAENWQWYSNFAVSIDLE